MNITLTILFLFMIFTVLAHAADNTDLHELYCQLNEYAKERAKKELDIFPCIKTN